jgi:Domain of unknown function (DUF4167)
MRNGQKRMRGRNGGHRKSQNPLTRVYESNGPDVKIRGTASHIAEKYIQLARDAQSSGDPVAAENYYQHAEHYFRLIAAAQEQFRQQNPYYGQQPGAGGQPNDEVFDDEEDVNQPFLGQNEPSYAPQPQSQAQPQGQPYLPRDAQPFPSRDQQRYGRHYQQIQPSSKPNSDDDMSGLPAFITGAGGGQLPANGGQQNNHEHGERGDRFGGGHRRRRRHRGGGGFRPDRTDPSSPFEGSSGGDES